MGTSLAFNELDADQTNDDRAMKRVLFGQAALLSAFATVTCFFPFPVERMADTWERDPGLAGSF